MAVTGGELYTAVTNKAAKGKNGALIALVAGTKAIDVTAVLTKIPEQSRAAVKEVTLDRSNAMNAIIRASFANAAIVTDPLPCATVNQRGRTRNQNSASTRSTAGGDGGYSRSPKREAD